MKKDNFKFFLEDDLPNLNDSMLYLQNPYDELLTQRQRSLTTGKATVVIPRKNPQQILD